jgi:Xaa-Pro aminopeptidase
VIGGYDRSEYEARWARIREAAAADDLDAVVVCSSEYTGFEGAMFYMSGFRMVHRYAYVLLPTDGEAPTNVFPREARWVGAHSDSVIEDKAFADVPGSWLADRFRERGWKRVGVYGLDYYMPVRDFEALRWSDSQLVRWDEGFDLARAVRSPAELESVRQSMRINEAGVWAVLAAYEPGINESELMAVAEQTFVGLGTGRLTMNMVLTGPEGRALPEMRHPDPFHQITSDELLLYGLEIAGRGGHWVEFSRPICDGELTPETQRMLEAYQAYHEICRGAMKPGATAHDVHIAVSEPFHDAGWKLGHVTGHSIGMTMIEHPRIGEGYDVELKENMTCSMHPHVISQDDQTCLYFQDTWHIQADGAVPLSDAPVRVYGTADREFAERELAALAVAVS